MDERPKDYEYDWPCWRHEAHGPHPIIDDKSPGGGEPRTCPGVGAHPNTMIGRNDVELLDGTWRD